SKPCSGYPPSTRAVELLPRLSVIACGRSARRCVCAARTHGARYDVECIEPAFEGAVVERNAARRFETDQLRQPGVGSEEAAAPAGEAALEPRPELGVELGQRFALADANAIRRVRHE